MYDLDAVVTITGHRKLTIPKPHKNLSSLVRATLEQVRVAMWPGKLKLNIGGALGADLVAMHHAQEMGIPFDVYLPFPFSLFTAKWEKHMISNAEKLMGFAGQVIVVGTEFDPSLYQERNMLMVDASAYVLAFWDGRSTGGTFKCLRYALRRGRPVYNGLAPLQPILKADIT